MTVVIYPDVQDPIASGDAAFLAPFSLLFSPVVRTADAMD
jgi:hypothetical protein